MHYDFNLAGAYAYEQAILAIKRLGLSMPTVEEQVRRAFFNILARNQDDHVKNIAFLMDRSGNWRLSPAFDLTYAYNPSGAWTGTHQMTLNGKRDGFHYEDLETFAVTSGLKKAKTRSLFAEVAVALEKWPRLANQAGVPQGQAEAIRSTLRTGIPGA
jgi:serine/threonine-protein kinase HipA